MTKKRKEQAATPAKEFHVGQTAKPPEPTGPAIDETVRTMQTGAWAQGHPSEYAPTSHTANKLTKMVLDVMPSVGKETDHSDAVMGALVPTQKAEWNYNQPIRT